MRHWLALTVLLLGTPFAAAFANDWGNFAIISDTLGNHAGRLCVGEGLRVSDIGCPTYAPSVTTAGDVSVTGNLSANKFIGDGSLLTGIGQGDRITSGTLAVVANSETSYVSLSTAATTWGYFSSGASYLPHLAATRVSSTNISTTLLQFATSAVTCTNGISGSIRWSAPSGTIQVCDGAGWVSLASGTTGGAGVSALASLTDVQFSNPAGRDHLRYDALSSKWVNISESTVMSTTTMVNGWPDAIRCSHGPTSGEVVTLYHYAGNAGGGTVMYKAPYATNYMNTYTSAGSYSLGPEMYNGGVANCVGKSIAQLYASGQAFNFIGNSGAGSTALGDRITSGTVSVTVNTDGFISLTTGVTDWGYLSSGNSYLPTLVSNRVSSTNISATHLQLSSPSTVLACGAGLEGAMRYTSGTMQVCNGTSWGNIGIGVPTGTIAAFSASSCPSGWTEYTASRGRFLRGIDNGAGYDPDGTRTPGNYQTDAFQGHWHAGYYSGTSGASGATGRVMSTSDNNNLAPANTVRDATTDSVNGTPRTEIETRPKNVAVTFCVYSGFQSAPGQTILTTLASLTDVSIAGVTTGQVLAFDGASWVPSDTTGGSSALGDRITSGTVSVTVNTDGYISLTTGVTDWGYLSSGNSYLPTLVAGRVSSTFVSSSIVDFSGTIVGTLGGPGGNFIASGTTSVSTSSDGNIRFSTADEERLVILPNGSLEIGGSAGIRMFAGADIVFGSHGYMAAEGNLWLNIDGDNNGTGSKFVIGTDRYGNSGGTDLVTVLESGNVGIGVSNPSHVLQISAQGRSTHSAWATSSDRRVKEDIHTITGGLAAIDKLRPVTFRYTKEYQNGNPALDGIRRGFIAQEVEEVMPDAVSRAEEHVGKRTISDFRVLGNSDFVPLLVSAVKELKAANDNTEQMLRAEIDELRRELRELKQADKK